VLPATTRQIAANTAETFIEMRTLLTQDIKFPQYFRLKCSSGGQAA